MGHVVNTIARVGLASVTGGASEIPTSSKTKILGSGPRVGTVTGAQAFAQSALSLGTTKTVESSGNKILDTAAKVGGAVTGAVAAVATGGAAYAAYAPAVVAPSVAPAVAAAEVPAFAAEAPAFAAPEVLSPEALEASQAESQVVGDLSHSLNAAIEGAAPGSGVLAAPGSVVGAGTVLAPLAETPWYVSAWEGAKNLLLGAAVGTEAQALTNKVPGVGSLTSFFTGGPQTPALGGPPPPGGLFPVPAGIPLAGVDFGGGGGGGGYFGNDGIPSPANTNLGMWIAGAVAIAVFGWAMFTLLGKR